MIDKNNYASQYEFHIRQVEDLTIKDIIRISKFALPREYQECPWRYPGLNHGKAILKTEEQCCAYMAAYGDMHKHKLHRALDEIESKFPCCSQFQKEWKFTIGDVVKESEQLL